MRDFEKDDFENLKPQTKDENIRATPAARRLAIKNTLPLKKVTGTGPMGRIEKKDVENIIKKIHKPLFVDAEKTGEQSTEKILEERSSNIGDHQLSFNRKGISGRTPLLFIHGFGSDSQTWRYSLGELSKTREVWTIDLPGHGNSLKFPMEYKSKSLFNEYSQILKEFLENTGLKRVHLIGHSLGGGIALNFALNHLNSVSSLTLLAPMGLGDNINEKFIESFAKGESVDEIRESLNLIFYNNSWVTDSLVNATVLQHQNPEFRKVLIRLASLLQKQDKQSWKVRDELQNLSMPVKLIWGKEDQILPSSHAQDLPGSFAVHIFPNTGHMVHIEQSQVINRLIGDNSARE
jgi:pyruvate dehydrogenase E2 component (dihydrolipoamide acetyltransferase)